jgi:hypothetical protein
MLILLVFKRYKELEKSKFAKNKEIKGSMCFGDQTTLPINRCHNAKKRGGNFETENESHKKKKPKPKTSLQKPPPP